jgi:hypothetical protein
MAYLWWSSKSQLISFGQESLNKNRTGYMACCVDCFGPKLFRCHMLIEHHLGHVNKVLILVFSNSFYRGTHKEKN